MKTNVIIAAVLMLICANLSAQESAQVNTIVAGNFETKFPGASTVRWQSQPKGISLAHFFVGNETWVAYYSAEGDLITSGKKIKVTNQLPIKVKESLKNVQTQYEGKFGALLFGSIFEMTNNAGTEYYIPMENNQLSLMLSIDSNGSVCIRKKERHVSPAKIEPVVIAKKN